MRLLAEEAFQTALVLTLSSTPTLASSRFLMLYSGDLLLSSAADSLLRARARAFSAHPSPVPASRLQPQGRP